ncbi:MAG TPA: hypothetical protein VK986_05400 [Tepidisphaeraceae bacterium]|nr:hypothetical protein [Tepidisphaeraceae bacterium]
MSFVLVQILFWIALATWFGGVLFVAMAAPVVFRTVKEHNPILPTVLAVNLEGQHGSLLSGTIVANLIAQLVRVELVCAGGLLIALVAQWWTTDAAGANYLPPLLRCALYLMLVGVVVYEWRVLWPRIGAQRQTYIDHADEPDVANPAKDEFDRLHRESVMLLTFRLALLLGMILFSVTIRAKGVEIVFPA